MCEKRIDFIEFLEWDHFINHSQRVERAGIPWGVHPTAEQYSDGWTFVVPASGVK
jgi:hypothetical protein